MSRDSLAFSAGIIQTKNGLLIQMTKCCIFERLLRGLRRIRSRGRDPSRGTRQSSWSL